MYISKKIIPLIIFFSICLIPSPTMAWSFAVISDTPEGDDTTQGEALINSIAFLNEKKPDFIVLLGDLTANGITDEFDTFSDVFLKKVNAPVVPVAGNHDFVIKTEKKTKAIISKGPINWYNFWKKQNTKLLSEYKSATLCGTETPGPRFRRFTYKGIGFTLIDPYFDDHKYGLTQTELDCIDSNVAAGDLVFRHVTPYGLTCDKSGTPCGSSVLGVNGGVADIDKLPKKLISKNAKALFAGHTHGYYHGKCDGLEYINNGTLGLRAREYVKGWTAADIADSFSWVDIDDGSGNMKVTIYVYDESNKTFKPQTKNFPNTVISTLALSAHTETGEKGPKEKEGVNATCTSIQPDGGTDSSTETVKELKIVKPTLEINIPQLKFSDLENNLEDINGVSYLNLPYIGEYMSAIYKVALVAISIIAVIMIIVEGVKITTIGGEARPAGFKKIGQVVIGLFIAWGSYTILYTINPDLVNFKALKVQYIVEIEAEEYEDTDSGDGAPYDPSAPHGKPSTKGDGAIIKKLIGPLPSTYPKCSKEAANYTADELTKKQICVGPYHCAYTASNFLEYIGCTDIYDGMATMLQVHLDQSGWVAETIRSKEQFQKLPFGMLANGGHVGISLGDGWQFDSGGNIPLINIAAGKKCIIPKKDLKNDPTLIIFSISKSSCSWGFFRNP